VSFKDLLHETFDALLANRGRSLLTVLGIVIGIAAVIAMTAMIGGIKVSMMGDLGLEQARLITANCWSEPGMQLRDVDAFREAFADDFDFITATNSGYGKVSSGAKEADLSMTGVQPNYAQAMQLKLAQGRFINDQESSSAALVAVLDETAVKSLFGNPNEQVVGKTLTIDSQTYSIVGVAVGGGSYGSGTAYLPLTTVAQRISGTSDVGTLLGIVREGHDVDAVAARMRAWLIETLRIPEDEADNYLWIQTMKAMIEEVNSVMSAFQVLLTSVASISLAVGGIGIMNMMLTNVTERIREIGLRKALGARSRDITRQFLLESVVLCLVGGVIGVLVGYFGSYAFLGLAGGLFFTGSETAIKPVIDLSSVLTATLICVGIGVLFGWYPARRAAKLDPVESLHYQ
jgi:putative ABC transport system permease protein